MTSIKKSSHPLHGLQRGVHSVFDDFFKDWNIPSFLRDMESKSDFMPAIDMKEEADLYSVSAELPGMAENDVKISLRENLLTLSGEKKEESEKKEGDFFHRETSYGSFTRTFALPSEVDLDKVIAKFDKGVLHITLPKSEKVKEKTKYIPIHS